MKEFKFWAITYTFKQLLLIAVPIWIIFIAIMFFIDMDKYFFYVWIGAFIWIVFCFLFIIKRVRITFSERKEISIYINRSHRYTATPDMLEYVKGANISNNRGRASLLMQFSDRKFTFSIWELHGLPAKDTNQQIELIRYMVYLYRLEKEYKKDRFLNNIYTYYNPLYNKPLQQEREYNKNEK